MLLHDPQDQYAKHAYNNVCKSLDYARLKFDELDISTTAPWPDLSRYSSLMSCAENLDLINTQNVEGIKNHVDSGGGFVVIYRGWNREMAELFGVLQAIDYSDFLAMDEEGLCFPGDLFPGFEKLILGSEELAGHTPYDLMPAPNAEIVATSIIGHPLAWINNFGRGKVLYWNSAVLAQKRARGLIVQSIACVQKICVLPIANVGIIQIDDFPNPTLEILSGDRTNGDDVKAPANIDVISFIHENWYPDMISLADRYDLVFTYLAVFCYTAATRAPYDFSQWQASKSRLDEQTVGAKTFAGLIRSQNGEIGLHGYNHVSLNLADWADSGEMVAALKATTKRWLADDLGPLPTTYVPPNNEIDAAGTLALTEAVPSLKVISGLYINTEFEVGGNREFGPEPWNHQLYAIPRATMGYDCAPETIFDMASQLGTMGVWTHFLHADDVFDTPEINPEAPYHRNENANPWREDHLNKQGQMVGLFDKFETCIKKVRSNFPWLRFVQTKEALPILRTYLDNDFDIQICANGVLLKTTSPGYFQVRTNNGSVLNPAKVLNAELIHITRGEGYELYTFKCLGTNAALEML